MQGAVAAVRAGAARARRARRRLHVSVVRSLLDPHRSAESGQLVDAHAAQLDDGRSAHRGSRLRIPGGKAMTQMFRGVRAGLTAAAMLLAPALAPAVPTAVFAQAGAPAGPPIAIT